MIRKLSISITSVVLLLLVASATILVQPGSSADYYKCVDTQGKLYISNVSCPALSEIKESKKLPEVSDAEHQEALRKEGQEKQKKEQVRRAEEELARERSKALALNQCLAQADASYRDRWNSICAFENRPNGCFLPAELLGNLDQSHRGSRDECIKLYPPR